MSTAGVVRYGAARHGGGVVRRGTVGYLGYKKIGDTKVIQNDGEKNVDT